MSTLLTRYVASANELSEELKKKTEEMRALDQKVEPVLGSMESTLLEYLRTRPSVNRRPTKKQKTLESQLQSQESLIVELCASKDAKAEELYTKVDKVIKKMDKSLEQLKLEVDREALRLGVDRQGGEDIVKGTMLRGGRGRAHGRGLVQGPLSRRAGRGRQRNMGLTEYGTAPMTSYLNPAPVQSGIPGALAHDIPLDSAEPRYCLCNGVSFGEMVACDHHECLQEWFHFPCVGLNEKDRPKGKWYCPQCTKTRALAKGGKR